MMEIEIVCDDHFATTLVIDESCQVKELLNIIRSIRFASCGQQDNLVVGVPHLGSDGRIFFKYLTSSVVLWGLIPSNRTIHVFGYESMRFQQKQQQLEDLSHQLKQLSQVMENSLHPGQSQRQGPPQTSYLLTNSSSSHSLDLEGSSALHGGPNRGIDASIVSIGAGMRPSNSSNELASIASAANGRSKASAKAAHVPAQPPAAFLAADAKIRTMTRQQAQQPPTPADAVPPVAAPRAPSEPISRSSSGSSSSGDSDSSSESEKEEKKAQERAAPVPPHTPVPAPALAPAPAPAPPVVPAVPSPASTMVPSPAASAIAMPSCHIIHMEDPTQPLPAIDSIVPATPPRTPISRASSLSSSSGSDSDSDSDSSSSGSGSDSDSEEEADEEEKHRAQTVEVVPVPSSPVVASFPAVLQPADAEADSGSESDSSSSSGASGSSSSSSGASGSTASTASSLSSTSRAPSVVLFTQPALSQPMATPSFSQPLGKAPPAALKALLVNPIPNKAPSHFLPLTSRTVAKEPAHTSGSSSSDSDSDGSSSDGDSDSSSSESDSEDEAKAQPPVATPTRTPVAAVRTSLQPQVVPQAQALNVRHSMMSGNVKGNVTRRKPPARQSEAFKQQQQQQQQPSLAEVIRNGNGNGEGVQAAAGDKRKPAAKRAPAVAKTPLAKKPKKN